MSPKLFEIMNLKKSYQGREVLKIDYLAFEEGRIYGIMGPSGAGKTTLLRLLNLLEEPTEGQIFFLGEDTAVNGTRRLALQRQMTMVFQKTVLFNTSVFENVAFGLKARRLNPAVVKERVFSALKDVGLKDLAQHCALSLSGGEAERLALARAMVLKPRVLLLDEPTANLDPANVATIENLVRTMHERDGTTIILVSHNLFQAERLADEVIFLYNGRVVEKGPTERVFHAPEDDRTRAFIEGRMVY